MTTFARATGNPAQEFNSHVTKLARIWGKHGVLMFRDTLSDEIAIIDGVSRDATQEYGLAIEGSTFKPMALSESLTVSDNPPKIIGRVSYAKHQLFGIGWSELADSFSLAAKNQSMPTLASKPQTFMLNQIIALLKTGESATCLYDDKTFFNTAHLIDPFSDLGDVAANQHPNLITQPQTHAGWNEVLKTITTRPAPGHRIDSANEIAAAFLPDRDLNGSNLTIWCGLPEQVATFRKMWKPGSLYAVANGPETREAFAQATVQYVPEIYSHDTGSASNYVYLIIKNEPELRGIYCRVPHSPEVVMTSAGSDVEVKKQCREVMAYQTFGKGFGFPFKVVKWKFS